MNYSKMYYSLIYGAKSRETVGYTEKHHIIPRCLGGSDNNDNLVNLTAREHYVAHQLLVKIYPDEYGLIYAANMMCVFSEDHQGNRSNNRLYEWLKVKFAGEMSRSQSGEGNSQYGTRWIHSIELKKSKKIRKDINLPVGWIEGRVVDFGAKERKHARILAAKEKRKQEKESKKIIEEAKKMNYARKVFDLYNSLGYNSIREFSKSEHWDYSHVTLTKLWKKYIPQYNPEKGKSFKKEL